MKAIELMQKLETVPPDAEVFLFDRRNGETTGHAGGDGERSLLRVYEIGAESLEQARKYDRKLPARKVVIVQNFVELL